MKGRFRLGRATRQRLVWLTLLLLLWQHVAVAATACATGTHSDVVAATSLGSHVPAGVVHQRACSLDHPGHASDALCDAHCHPQQATAQASQSGSVPPSMAPLLPPIDIALAAIQPPVGGCASEMATADNALPAQPPASLLFCSLLI